MLGRMPRWEPNGRERLVRAALELFTEQGYDNTTVTEIAERAGLNKSTFFRHFRDKREVLFGGQDTLCALFAEGIAAAPESATPLEAVASALEATAVHFPPERRDFGPRLRAVVAANPELQERNALKRIGFAAAMTTALRARGVPDTTATLAAEIGVLAFAKAHTRWGADDNDLTFAELAHEALHDLTDASVALNQATADV